VNFQFSNRKVTGVLGIVPANERKFVDEMANFNFPPARSLKLKEVMGYDRHRIVAGPTCVSDLAVHGLEHLFRSGRLGRDDFDALIVVTQSPDYFMPPTSSVIQGRLGLKQDMFCLDVNQGCAGFLIGLFQGFLLLDQPSVRKVILVNGDVLSRKVSPRDRNSYPLIGDAASIAVLERSSEAEPIFANLKMDGTRAQALTIPAGGFRIPSTPETAVLEQDAEGNLRAKDHLRMDGSAVFNFVQLEVPPMIQALLQSAGKSIDDVDAFLFHQPNRFMLEKLADKMRVPRERMPSNIVENFGNSSGVTIPLVLALNLRDRLRTGTITGCLAGFGVGLTWSSMLLRLGPLDFCEIVDFDEGSIRAGAS
jgi:3-oxoacyl-[acyl-carrier-protein] synthase III